MRKIGLILTGLCAFAVGYSINNTAFSDPTPPKVAVVDVQQLIANSSEVKTLKAQQERKINDMKSTVDKARAEITAEQDPNKIAALEEKYRNEINNQKLALDSEYNTRLNQIDNNIKSIVVSKAKEMHYDIVLPKNVVLYGGDDLTQEVAKSVK